MICSMLVSAVAPGAAGLAWAQSDASLADPTRPPVTASEPVASGAVDAAAPSGLQTIIIGRGRKPMAVINGIMVGLGDKIGEATLVKLSESEAVLLGPAGREVLQLLPGVAKNMNAASVKKVQGKTYDK
jgi:MSHA biogenesis protein MshK